MEEGTRNEDYVPCTWENLTDVQMENEKPLTIRKIMEVKIISLLMHQRKEIRSIN